MLTGQQKTLRRFWYAIMPISHLAEGAKPFRLMNEDIVVFLDAEGEPTVEQRRLQREEPVHQPEHTEGTLQAPEAPRLDPRSVPPARRAASVRHLSRRPSSPRS